MKNIKTLLCGVTLAAVVAAPAFAFPIRDAGTREVGQCLNDTGTFVELGNNLWGLRFTINQDVTVGSNLALTLDSFGSQGLGSDTELGLYNGDGTSLLAGNDDAGDGSFDSYLGFGDAPQFASPVNGFTRQGNAIPPNQLNLLAGTYLIVIGPFDTRWDEFIAADTAVDNRQGSSPWACQVCLYVVPAPGSFALLGLGTLVIGGRRRRA